MSKQKLIGKSGIYAIVVQEGSEKVIRYIGSGSNLESRKSNHFSRLRKGKHIKKLQKLFDEVGEDHFRFYVIDYCNKSSLYKLEKLHKKIHEDTVYNVNEIRTTKKKVRTEKETMKHKQKFRKMNSGTNNPNCRLDKESIFDILDMIEDGVSKNMIAKKFDVSRNYLSRLGKDRRVEEYKEWQKQKETVTSANVQSRGATAIAQ